MIFGGFQVILDSNEAPAAARREEPAHA
jgi:hypothetical protein